MKILVTGGAGFIGSRLSAKLVAEGHCVSILDSLAEQVHGADAAFPSALSAIAECRHGSVLDREAVAGMLEGVDCVIHLAAETGTGQSMYDVERYVDVNVRGTAILIEAMSRQKVPPRIVVASSRAIYGEGRFVCQEHGDIYPGSRRNEDLKAGRFDHACPVCGNPVHFGPTPESAPAKPVSVYGVTKLAQEQLCLTYGWAHHVSAIALRLQNVFGPGQSLANPYTGILAIFSNLAINLRDLNIYEDGRSIRDFVYVDDAVNALALAVGFRSAEPRAFNIGSGSATTLGEAAAAIAAHFKGVRTEVSGMFRTGDIRANVADISAAADLGFIPGWGFQRGLEALLAWVKEQNPASIDVRSSERELVARGLLQDRTSP